jgi:hypothetical protein
MGYKIKNVIIRYISNIFHHKLKKSWVDYSKKNYQVIENVLFVDPLSLKNLGLQKVRINILMLIGPLDLNTFHLALLGGMHTSKNIIGKIILITPRENVLLVENKVNELLKSFKVVDFEVLSDDEIIGDFPRIVAILNKVPTKRKNWYLQQVIKILVATKYNEPILVIDSDLIIISKRLWVNDAGDHLVYLRNEFNPQYNVTINKLFKYKFPFFDFVSHCAIFLGRYFLQMANGEIEDFLVKIIRISNSKYHSSPISEYQTYGQFMFKYYPESLYSAKQNQINVDLRELHLGIDYNKLASDFKNYDAVHLIHKDLVR